MEAAGGGCGGEAPFASSVLRGQGQESGPVAALRGHPARGGHLRPLEQDVPARGVKDNPQTELEGPGQVEGWR